MTTPSKGAMRAAKATGVMWLLYGACYSAQEAADIIDHETGSSLMLEALKDVQAWSKARNVHFGEPWARLMAQVDAAIHAVENGESQ